jgi:hypothetical protein
MTTQKSKKEKKSPIAASKTENKDVSNDDVTYISAKKFIKTPTEAYIFLAFRFFLPKNCIKCHKKDCYSYVDENEAVITCIHCGNNTKLNKLPIKDPIMLAQIIWYYKSTNKSIDRIAEVFNIKKSKVLKCLWWMMNKFTSEGDRLVNNSNRKNFLINEISYLTLKNRLAYKLTSLRFDARHSSQDN